MTKPTQDVTTDALVGFGPLAEPLGAALVPGGVFATDADGTLWEEDIGEALLRALAAEGRLVHPDALGRDVWGEYERRVAIDKYDGYTWAVRVMAGLREADLQAFCARFVADWVPPRAHASMRALVSAASARGTATWIVSASNRWVVAAAAAQVGIEPSRALGIEVAVEGGVLVDRLLSPVTFRGGKVDAIRGRAGVTPDLAAGDSMGDFELLSSARVPLVVAHRGASGAFVDESRARGWLVHVPGAGVLS